MTACVILHNMIVEDERGLPHGLDYDGGNTMVEPGRLESVDFSQFVDNVLHLQDETAHHSLRNNLVKHLRAIKGRSEE
jgi:hypothetical protein